MFLAELAAVPDVEVEAVLEVGAAELAARQQERLVRAVEVVRRRARSPAMPESARKRVPTVSVAGLLEVERVVAVELDVVRAILRQRAVAVREQLDEVVLRRDVRIDLAVVVRDEARVVTLGARVRVRALDVELFENRRVSVSWSAL